jgi:glycosyltransferase involved in cell wall biosynthesis
MKILFLTRLFYPHVGGVEKHLEKISDILIKKGNAVTILTTHFEDGLKDEEIYRKIKVIRFFQPEVKYFGLLYTWLWLLKNRTLINQNDIIHIHDVFIWYWPFRFLYPRKRVYITYHGQWGKYPLSKLDILQKKVGVRFSDGIISIGNYIDKNYNIKSNYISYGAVNSPQQSSVTRDKMILYIGRLDKITGLPIFLDMLHKYRSVFGKDNLKVVFCGDGELRTECAMYGKVMGWSDPTNLYRKASFVFASGYLTILEALANKCLVLVAYANPLQRDYYTLTPFAKYILTSPDYLDLYAKFKHYSDNNKAYKSKIIAGRRWVKDETWEKLVGNYLKLWNTYSLQ